MGKYRVGYFFLLLLVVFAGLTGCNGRNSGGPALSSLPAVPGEPLTNVRLVITGSENNLAIRAQTTEAPQVFFELRLLDRSSSLSPIVMLRKQAQVTVVNGSYSATALFEAVPVLPAIASMSINGGFLTGANNQPYKIWVGKKDLVAASENIISLVGAGDKSATDVSVNLLEKLIAVPANVATLAQPIFAKVDEVVAGLDLTSSTVYDDALKAYNAAFSSIAVPADAEFDLPANYASLAYPKKDSSVSLVMPAFKAASESWVLLMNRSAGSLTPTWSVPQATTGSIRASTVEPVQPNPDVRYLPTAEEMKFQLKLRNFQKPVAGPAAVRPLVRPSRRAVLVNESDDFKVYASVSGVVSQISINARCKKISEINGRKTLFFLDNNDAAVPGVDAIIDAIYDSWHLGSIYNTNRRVFGEEPPGTHISADPDQYATSGDATDLYILISRQIYTAGYFYGADLYPASVFPESNYKKIFYLQLDSDLTDAAKVVNDLSATMSHEFQHMIHHWQKRKLPLADPWLDEAMSGYAEHINGYRIENGKNQSKALQANNYFERVNSIRVDKWHLDGDASLVMSAHYGKAFLFGIWLAQNYGSSDSVQNLLSIQLSEKAAVEAFTGEAFDKTFAKFMLAMAVNDTNGGTYGITGLSLTSTYSFGAGWAPVTLTGPAKTLVNVSLAGGSGGPTVAPYAAAYVKITNGNDSNVTINATLPSGTSLFQLQR